MKLLKCILIVQLSCLCQDPTYVQVRAEGNNTRAEIQEEFNSDPYVHRLAGKCSFTLRKRGHRSSDVVALAAASTDELVEQMCQDLDCDSVFHVNKTSSPPNAMCLHDCLYRDGRLQNCSQSVGGNCTVIAEAVCGRQAVRLAGGSGRCAGRVELWRQGRWGTVCDDQWDLQDADVVCAQLGCGYALRVTGQGGSFPPGRGSVYLDELNCTGREENLWACPAAQDELDCGHKEDAGVVCSEMRAVRLTGGQDRCSGKVEVHRNGSWGTLCDNCWNENLASMVCAMLQCGTKPQKYTQFIPPLAHNNGTLWFYKCNENTQNLWRCREYVNTPHLCISSKASGVICNGSLGFIAATTTTTANATMMTSWTTAATSVHRVEDFSLPSPERLSTMTLALLLLVVLITSSVVCCYYRRRHAYLLQQTRSGTRPLSEHRHNSYQDAVDLVKVTSNPLQAEVPSNHRYLWTQLSSVDSMSVDTDYEQYEPSNDPAVPLSTFRNSQRYRTDVNPFMRPSGLDSLFEEAAEPTREVMGVFTSCNGGPAEAQYGRLSKISVDSFDTSSTSSGENANNSYVTVSPEPAPGQPPVAFDLSRPVYSKIQLHPRQTTNLQKSDDEDDGPIYSPVSPDQHSSSEDDYDDIGTL
ncbi:T-cell differentiation antigen CD6-like isoform X2 [Cottoperca gobio]|uniref:T-cell differentiation antigen CD6-like isoform X2 n=1 Tax=Cottoperca gobio TaxID=56716 RepID=A0A6J2QLX3_COTGO|nr:T-cell differentiation antigen CD6-like isoform X2 [Cottoperca gobio]